MDLERFLKILQTEFEFDTEGIDEDTTFDDINFDELDMIDLVMAVEDELGTEVSDEALEKIKTVGDFIAYLNEKD